MEDMTNYEKVFFHYQQEVLKLDLEEVETRLFLTSDNNNLVMPFFDRIFLIDKKTGDVCEKNNVPIDITEKLLALQHIYYSKKNIRPPGEFISFREIKGLEFFDKNYQGRTITPLAKAFDTKPAEFLRRGLAMGGTKESFGDASFRIKAFPLMELIFVFWDGEDGIIPPASNILFNKNIPDLIHLESIPVLANVGSKYFY